MIFDDETDPKTRKPKLRPLDKMSVEELKAYVDDLKTEITRVEVEIGAKQKHKDAVSALFKS